MKKFLVLYLAPARVIEEWKEPDPQTRKAAEEKTQANWKKWGSDHAKMFADMGAGISKQNVSAPRAFGHRNDVMLYAIVEADSHDAAAKSFVGHPHLGIPAASIEIMEIHPLPGMANTKA